MNMRLIVLLLCSTVILALAAGVGCGKTAKQAAPQATTEEADEPAAPTDRPELTSTQQQRLDALGPESGLLPIKLARALVDAPSGWAQEMVQRVYPEAQLKEDNPRVNQLFEVHVPGAPVNQIDVRWKSTDRKAIGSVVFVYGSSQDREALQTAIGQAGQPIEGALREWLLAEAGLRLTYYAEGYEGGGPRVTFAGKELDGAPISREEDRMKEAHTWDVARPRPSRAPEEQADPRLAPPEDTKPGRQTGKAAAKQKE